MIKNYLDQFARTPTHFGEPPRARTLDIHTRHLRRFEEAHPEFSISAAKEYILSLICAKAGASSVNHALAALDGYIEYLTDSESIPESALKSWRTFKRKSHQTWRRKNRHVKYLSNSGLRDLMQAVVKHAQSRAQANRDLGILGLILFGPCRGGEVLQLRLDDVQLVDSTESIPGHWLFHFRAEITKDHEEKWVRLFAGESCIGDIDIFDAFSTYAAWRKSEVSPTGDLFVRVRKPYTPDAVSRVNLWYSFKRYAQAAGIHASPHWLRHTFGEQTAGRIDEREVRQMFGHSSDQTTQGYTDHDNPERLMSAQLQAARIIRGPAV